MRGGLESFAAAPRDVHTDTAGCVFRGHVAGAHEDHRIPKHTCVSLSQVLLSRTGASLLMGSGTSLEEVQWQHRASEEKKQQEYESLLKSLEAADTGTKVPHLLIELRSLGFVEVQGKDTGGDLRQVGSLAQENVGGAMRLKQDVVCIPVEVTPWGCCLRGEMRSVPWNR